MAPLIQLAISILAQVAADRARASARRAALLALAGLCALVALGFLIAAGWTALAAWCGPIFASLSCAGGFLLLALILWLVSRRRRPRPIGLNAAEIQALEAEATALLNQFPEAIGKAPFLSLAGAFLGGLLLALRLRR